MSYFSVETKAYFDKATCYQKKLTGKILSVTVGSHDVGHFFTLSITHKKGAVDGLSFDCPRCVPAIAVGALLEERLLGSFLPALKITTPGIVYELAGLPPQRAFYAWMGAHAVQELQERMTNAAR